MSDKKPQASGAPMGVGVGVGVALGAAMGIVTDNLALWVGCGLAIGAGMGGAVMAARKPKNDESDSSEAE
jgi:hypothetical protein